MGHQVLLVGQLRPDLGMSGSHEGLAVADLRHPDAVQDAVRRLARDGDVVLVLCGAGDLPDVRRQLALLAVALPHVTAVLEPVAGTPLAVGVCGALVTDPDGSRDPADQLALLDRLRARVWSAVWLPSVGRLADPSPSLGQHVRGWFAGSGFLAVGTGEGARVLPCKGTTLPSVAEETGGGVLMVAATDAPDWVVPAAMAATAASERTDLTSWRETRDAFGTSASVELVVVPADLEGLDGGPAASSPAAEDCDGCGRRHHRPVCPYCRMVRAVAAGTPEPSPHDLQGVDA